MSNIAKPYYVQFVNFLEDYDPPLDTQFKASR